MEQQKLQVRDLRNGDWLWINKLVLDHPYLTSSAKVIYSALAYFANNDTQKSYPSIKKIMELTGLGSRSTIVSSIKKLEEYYFISAKRKGGKVTEYTLLKLTDSQPVHKLNQSNLGHNQSKISTGVVQNKHTNNTNTILNNNNKTADFNNLKRLNDLKRKYPFKAITTPQERTKIQEEVGPKLRR